MVPATHLTIGAWCERWLGAGIAEVLFEAGSESKVTGVRLTDDSQVVIKVRRPAARLRAAYLVQQQVWRSGYPAPEPLGPPTPLSDTESASAERLIPGGAAGGRSPADAARSAEALARLLGLSFPGVDPDDLAPSPPWAAWDHADSGLWPDREAGRPDLNAVQGPAWLDEAAARSRERLIAYQAPRIIGHADWHAGNVLWSGPELWVVHDWDSVACQPEAVLVGLAAAMFTASEASWQPATVEESTEFLNAYLRATSQAWTQADIEAFWAATVWTRASDAKEERIGGPIRGLDEAEAFARLFRAGA